MPNFRFCVKWTSMRKKCKKKVSSGDTTGMKILVIGEENNMVEKINRTW